MSNKVQTWVKDHVFGIGAVPKAVLKQLGDYANDDGVSWPGKVSLARDVDCDKRTVDRAITKLERLGLIKIQKRKAKSGLDTSNVYLIQMHQLGLFGQIHDFSNDKKQRSGVADCHGGQIATPGTVPGGRVAESPNRGGTVPPEPSVNHQLEPSVCSSADAEAHSDRYETAKGKVLKAMVLRRFNRFWSAFGYKSGKATAADAWLEVEMRLANGSANLDQVLRAANAEARGRDKLREGGATPKMAQGWLAGRRWEDHQAPDQVKGKPADPLPWYRTIDGVQEEAGHRGILNIDYPYPADLTQALIQDMEAKGDSVPEELRDYRKQMLSLALAS